MTKQISSESYEMAYIDSRVEFVFFDIGGTLGERSAASGVFVPFPSSAPLLNALRDVLQLRVGVITTLGGLSTAEGRELLDLAGLLKYIDEEGFVSEHDVQGLAKPHPGIYQFAAEKVRVPIERCLFIGESLIEVVGAKCAGMQTQLKPSPPGRELSA